MRQGDRCDLVLTCQHHTHYEARNRRGEDVTVHRYTFIDRDRRHYVYSGLHLWKLRNGGTFHIRATIKRLEPAFGSIRLARLVIGEPFSLVGQLPLN